MHGCLFVLVVALLATLLMVTLTLAFFWKWVLLLGVALVLVSTFRACWEYAARLRR